ncbi:type II restriction endonuclease [Spirosoma sp. BT702]|uniref:site-specific DNA-methyltransferase (adenine-specific) n=1 Tax=Spirosoma profusum TaxID=2771354 RepID=A0A927AVP2_9BACT|nr:type II restriction endonuclease [Spirosoma profusum]
MRQYSQAIPLINPEAGWVILSPAETRIRQKIEEAGVPLKEWDVNIYRGVLTGYNDAFIIDGVTKDELIRQDPKSAEIIRPILRGKDIKPYIAEYADKWLINAHNGLRATKLERVNVPLDYPIVFEYLDQEKFKPLLQNREDKGSHWTNLRNCAYFQDFEKPKIIYPEITKFLPFVYDEKKYFLNNKTFFMVGSHLKYLASLFNSTLFKAIFKGYFPDLGEDRRELRKVFFEQVKIIIPAFIIEETLGAIVDEISVRKGMAASTAKLEAEIDHIIYKLYNLNEEEIEFVKSAGLI